MLKTIPASAEGGLSFSTCILILLEFLFCGIVIIVLYRTSWTLLGYVETNTNDGILFSVMRYTANHCWPGLVCAVPGLLSIVMFLFAFKNRVSRFGLRSLVTWVLVLGGKIVGTCMTLMVYLYTVTDLHQSFVKLAPSVTTSILLTLVLKVLSHPCFNISTYNFLSTGIIFGAFLGFMRTFETESAFAIRHIGDVGSAFARGVVSTLFWISLAGISASCIFRAKVGRSKAYHLNAILLPSCLALFFGYVSGVAEWDTSGFASSALCWFIGHALLTLVAVLCAVLLSRPLLATTHTQGDDPHILCAKSLFVPGSPPSDLVVV